jgi:hypothetical protein
MTTLYLVREMKLIGATHNVYNEIYLSDSAKFIYEGNRLNKVRDNGETWENTRYYKLSHKPIGVNMDKDYFLPYFAKVTEDLPGSCKGMRPKVYDKCQLTTQSPNGYLVFQDLATKKHLKIAINSHTYEPIK